MSLALLTSSTLLLHQFPIIWEDDDGHLHRGVVVAINTPLNGNHIALTADRLTGRFVEVPLKDARMEFAHEEKNT